MIENQEVVEEINTQGPGEPIIPPKGYVPTNVIQRKDWNTFLDYVKGQPNADLSNPQTGIGLLNQYKQSNPGFSITPEMIPNIQYEQNQFRKGDSFGNLNADQLKAVRAGMSPNFINQSDPYKSYYPQFKAGNQDFGTDIEGYAKFKSGGTVPTPVATNNTPIPPVATKEIHPANTIPLPDFNDPKSRLNYAKEFTKQGGPLLKGYGDTPLNVNAIPDAGSDTSKNISIKAAGKFGLDPALLYSSSMVEGMSGLFPDEKGQITGSANDDKDYPISGFINFGLDNFSDAYPGLVKKGYLSKDFASNFRKQNDVNEKNQTVHSANFKTPEAALEAKAAMIKDAQDQTEEYAKKSNIPLSDRAKQFFTLVNYNAGSGNMQKMLKEYNRSGYLKNDDFIYKRPSESWKGPWENVARRLQLADQLKKQKLFD